MYPDNHHIDLDLGIEVDLGLELCTRRQCVKFTATMQFTYTITLVPAVQAVRATWSAACVCHYALRISTVSTSVPVRAACDG